MAAEVEQWIESDEWGVNIHQGSAMVTLTSLELEQLMDKLRYEVESPEVCDTGFCESYVARPDANKCAGCEEQE